MVSHPENGSDSPIGSNRDRGRDKSFKGVPSRSDCTLQWYTTSYTSPKRRGASM